MTESRSVATQPDLPMRELQKDTLIVRDDIAVPDGFASLMRPTHRASTILFRDAEAFARRREQFFHGYSYGLSGTPTHYALAGKLAQLEGASHCMLAPSGLGAINLINQTVLSQGAHVLITDSAYGPTRANTQKVFGRYGVTADFYDPRIGGEIRSLIRPETRLIWMESPGSLTMEVQDVPAITAAAHEKGVLVALDNTWATPIHFSPLQHGVDFSVQALTKYVNGHSDVLMGSVCVKDLELFKQLKLTADLLGNNVSPDDCTHVLRGLVTLGVRLDRHERNGLIVAKWLAQQPEVQQVLYPALESSQDHALWKRDFSGASGLMSVVLATNAWDKASRFADSLQVFRIGASWGGPQSLIGIYPDVGERSTDSWKSSGAFVRISVGLEAPEDLIADLRQALDAAAIASGE
jgi:cystathionine beta-lyase